MNRLYFIILVLLNFQICGQSILVMNEMMSDNETTLADDQGNYEDWIEIFNPGNATCTLENYFLSDDPENLFKWNFPEGIELTPGSFLLVFASCRDTMIGTFIHTNFHINADGEWLFLTHCEGQVIDSLPPVELGDDISYGRRPDGSEIFIMFDLPTPGFSNNLSNSITFSHDGGYFTYPLLLHIHIDDPQADLYYTLDGSVPQTTSMIYTEPVLLDFRYGDPNIISSIPTTPDSTYLPGFYWKPPVNQVNKAHALRVRSFKEGQPSSKVYSRTYFIDSLAFDRYPFPIISLITDPINFFDPDSGIYIPGNTWDPEYPLWSGNYFQVGDEWERPIHVEFFETDGSLLLTQDAGVRIKGKSTRRRPQKSLTLKARSIYGEKKFNYPLFPDRDVENYNSFLLRNTFGCMQETIFKDALSHRLVRNLNFDIMDYRPVIVFLNGEYWGFHNMREDQDEHYLAGLYDIEEDSINILKNGGAVQHGTGESYQQLLSYIAENDLSIESNYNHVITQIDISNYIDYQIAEIYLNNYDWPGSNIEFWQTPEMDNRWRWLFFDLDFGWNNAEYNMLEHAILEGGSEWPNPDWSTFLFRNLLKNEAFKTQFINRFAELLNTLFQPDTLISLVHAFQLQYEPLMDEQIKRYGYPNSVEYWENAIWNYLIKFAEERPCVMEEQIIEFFDLSEFAFHCEAGTRSGSQSYTLFLSPNPSRGIIKINPSFNTPFEIAIYDSMARQKFKEYYSRAGNQEIQLDVSFLENGIYLIRLNKNGILSSVKLIINK